MKDASIEGKVEAVECRMVGCRVEFAFEAPEDRFKKLDPLLRNRPISDFRMWGTGVPGNPNAVSYFFLEQNNRDLADHERWLEDVRAGRARPYLDKFLGRSKR